MTKTSAILYADNKEVFQQGKIVNATEAVLNEEFGIIIYSDMQILPQPITAWRCLSIPPKFSGGIDKQYRALMG